MSYEPDRLAKPTGTLFIRQLSQRDLALSIPVNYVEHAAVSLTAACFADDRYVAAAAQRCFSNLLAIGFHRYEIDVFWDVSRQLWSLCPVELGAGEGSSEGGLASSSTGEAATATTAQATDISLVAMTSEAALQRRATEVIGRRPATTTEPPSASTTPSQLLTDEPNATAPTGPATPSTVESSANENLPAGDVLQLGPYVCSPSADLDWLSRVMWTYLDTTETNLNATLRYMMLNLHAALPRSDPTRSAEEPSPDALPSGDASLSSLLVSNLTSFLYTPADLQEQRANINASWYNVPQGMDSTPGYYRLTGRRDSYSTPDGWPSENFVEMQQGKRLFVGFGTIDPQMQGYDVSQDLDAIFPQDYLQTTREVSMEASGEVTSGCFYTPGQYGVNAANNNSWVFSVNADDTTPSLLFSSSNITQCGISPILNSTIQDKTADQDFVPYQAYFQSTLWAWAPGFPHIMNETERLPQGDSGESEEDFDDLSRQPRCAALNAFSGLWQNVVCDSVHYSACRRRGSLYEWSVSTDDATYTKAGLSCRDDSSFDVPRTGLQNAYLLNTWRDHLTDPATDPDAAVDGMLWLNFNNLDSELCWVIGQNSTCPYVGRRADDRQIVVPIVAAVIVFALGVLTVFVKCAANRRLNKRQKRRRKKGDDGWDYEGVPS